MPSTGPTRNAGIDKRTTGRPKTGKSSNPDYATAFILIRKDTKKLVAQRLVDSGMDTSELIESLLNDWLKKA